LYAEEVDFRKQQISETMGKRCAVSTGRTLEREEDILAEALSQVRSRLPAQWTLELQRDPSLFGPDAVVALDPPDGSGTLLVIEVKRSIVTKDLRPVIDQLNAYISAGLYNKRPKQGAPVPMVVARYLPPPLQNWLTDNDVPYADATGNLRIAMDRPAIFLRDIGATNDPWRGPGRPKGNLTGEPAARVVRALVDFRPPYSVPTVIELANASSGATYRVIDFLEDQTLVERAPKGPIEDVRWRPLLDRWAKDYGFSRTNTVTSYLAPRGLAELMGRLADVAAEGDVRYAVTGTLAAERWAPYAPARNAMIYTSNPAEFAHRMELREVDAGANVLLAKNAYDVVYDRTETFKNVTIVAASQAVVDLLTGPGRNPAEAEALMDWMEANEDDWRKR
jgi:transcriptional regulator with AbiEi antitoxin domain of type IV toxin-antitoxin system